MRTERQNKQLLVISVDDTITAKDLDNSVILAINGIWRCFGCDERMTVANAGVFSGVPQGPYRLRAYIHLGRSCKEEADRIIFMASLPTNDFFIAALLPNMTAVNRPLDPAILRRLAQAPTRTHAQKPIPTVFRPIVLTA